MFGIVVAFVVGVVVGVVAHKALIAFAQKVEKATGKAVDEVKSKL